MFHYISLRYHGMWRHAHTCKTYCSATLMKERSYVTCNSLCKIHFFSYVATVNVVVMQLCMLWHISANICCNSLLFCLKCSESIYPKDTTANKVLHHILYRYLQSIIDFQNTIQFHGTGINSIYACQSNMVLPDSTCTKFKNS